jgi:hypothetical protein
MEGIPICPLRAASYAYGAMQVFCALLVRVPRVPPWLAAQEMPVRRDRLAGTGQGV